MPSISVIVPVYNVEKYLSQCVESILSQTLKDIEILLVNDASTDHSLQIALTYQKDSRVKVLDKPHGGLGDTRNYGVAHASGKYLVFIDSDDWIDSGMLQNLFACAEEHCSDMVVFNYVRENQTDGEQRVCKLPVNFPECGPEIQEMLLAELIGPDNTDTAWRKVEMLGCAWRRMYRRDWFVANRLTYYDEQKIMLEDLPVTIQAHCLAKRVLVVGGAYYHYRYNPDSLSIRYRPKKMEMMTECFQIIEKFLKDQKKYEPYKERHLAWLLRSAAHSSFVNCFSPLHRVGFSERYREVKGILKNPLLKQAANSHYLENGTKADRLILKAIRTGNTFVVYLFYQFYSNMLLKNVRKK
ncbi:MAG TPA: glycosyltransferase family 2 protein [Caproiciproducens sp.]|nr:glycosyltransferase family 2 protein [Caproiciproducens sp.]